MTALSIATKDQPDTATLSIEPLSARTGAIISGIDLARPLDDATARAIRVALLQWKVVFFRDQHDLDDAGQEAFAERFGELLKHPIAPVAGQSAALMDINLSEAYAASRWHTDMTFLPAYASISVLRPLVLPEHGGDTMWSNTAAAYDRLPAPLKALADGMRAIHTTLYDFEGSFSDDYRAHMKNYAEQSHKASLLAEHPVVRVHPETGERSLVLGAWLKRILGFDNEDSRALQAIFERYVTAPEVTVRWRWRMGDLAMWDNRATQHRSVPDMGDAPRSLRRATLIGDVPVGVDGRPSRKVGE